MHHCVLGRKEKLVVNKVSTLFNKAATPAVGRDREVDPSKQCTSSPFYSSLMGSGSIEAVHIKPFLFKLGSPLGYDPSQYGSLMQMLAGIPAFTPIWDKNRKAYKLNYRNTLTSLVHFATLVDPAYEGAEHYYSKRWITFRVFQSMKTSGKNFKKTYGKGTAFTNRRCIIY